MKKIYLPLLAVCGFLQTQAQEFNPADAVRIGTQQVNGSARFNAMGGAFGALGVDVYFHLCHLRQCRLYA